MRFRGCSFSHIKICSYLSLRAPGKAEEFSTIGVERRLYCQGVGLAPLGRTTEHWGGGRRNHEQTPIHLILSPIESSSGGGGNREDDAGWPERSAVSWSSASPRHRFHFRFCNSQAITQTRGFLVCPESRKESQCLQDFSSYLHLLLRGSEADAPFGDGSIFVMMQLNFCHDAAQ